MKPRDEEGDAEVMRAVMDEHRLLEGEDPDTDDPEAVRRWAAIYAELLSFKLGIGSRMQAEHDRLAEPARHEVARDLHLVEREIRRLRGRLTFWSTRHLRLGGLLDDSNPTHLAFGEKRLQLSRRESQLLSFLSKNPEISFQTAALASRAWHDPALSAAQVRNYVSRLRHKLQMVEAPCRIETANGSGYRLTWSDGLSG